MIVINIIVVSVKYDISIIGRIVTYVDYNSIGSIINKVS